MQLIADHTQLFNSDLDVGQVVLACFAIPLAVVATVILLIRLLTRTGRRHDVDDRVSHLPSNNLGLDDIGPARLGDEQQVHMHHE